MKHLGNWGMYILAGTCPSSSIATAYPVSHLRVTRRDLLPHRHVAVTVPTPWPPPGALSPRAPFAQTHDFQTSPCILNQLELRRTGRGSHSNQNNGLTAGLVKIVQNIKRMSVSESRFGKSKRQTKKPWNPNFKATLWHECETDGQRQASSFI